MEAKDTLRIREVSEWLQSRDAAAHVSGPGVDAYPGQVAGLPQIEPGRRGPTAEGILRVGLPRLLRGERDDVWGLEPIYLRPSAAEEQWRRRGNG